MRLLVFSYTAVSGPQLSKVKPHSIIYAVIVHEVYFALSGAARRASPQRARARRAAALAKRWRGRLPNQYLGHLRPLTSSGKPSCDGSTSEFRIVDLIAQHDVSADEQFSGGSYFGLRTAAALCHSFVETL